MCRKNCLKKTYILTVLIFFLLISCAGKQGYKLSERPAILDNKAVVKFSSHSRGKQITAFLAAHGKNKTAGLCQRMLTSEGAISNWCIITEKGIASLIVNDTTEKFGNGYRVSNLKYKGKNKFYNTDSNQYIYLTPYSTTE